MQLIKMSFCRSDIGDTSVYFISSALASRRYHIYEEALLFHGDFPGLENNTKYLKYFVHPQCVCLCNSAANPFTAEQLRQT